MCSFEELCKLCPALLLRCHSQACPVGHDLATFENIKTGTD